MNNPEKLRAEENACMIHSWKNEKWVSKKVAWDLSFIKKDKKVVDISNKLNIQKGVKQNSTVWELEMVEDLIPLTDKKNRPFFPVLFLAVDETSGMVLDLEISSPDKSIGSDTFISNLIKKVKSYPSEIKIRNPFILDEVEEACRNLSIKVKKVTRLPNVEEVLSEMKKKGVLKRNTDNEVIPHEKRLAPKVEISDQDAVIEMPRFPKKLSALIEKYENLYDSSDDWESLVETGNLIISEAACQFDIYSFLFDFYVSEEDYEEADRINNMAAFEVYKLIDMIPEGVFVRWGFFENRPFLRFIAKIGLLALGTKKYKESRMYFELLLEYNPEDNLGIRGLILKTYFELNDYEAALRVVKHYQKDRMVETVFGRVLVLLCLGKKSEAEKQFKLAIKEFPNVLKELKKKSHPCPNGYDEEYITYGSEDEAYHYYQMYGKYWKKNKNAQDLLIRFDG